MTCWPTWIEPRSSSPISMPSSCVSAWTLSKGNRSLLQGRGEAYKDTWRPKDRCSSGSCLTLMGMKNILAINDEAHHCYRERTTGANGDGDLKGEDKKEAEKRNEAARVWISGLEMVNRKLGTNRVIDLSATPFFLRGSGYAEGTLFPGP
jgi:type III restriction enzyme